MVFTPGETRARCGDGIATDIAHATADAGAAGGVRARRHDLDALRGATMLLGIALHAAMPFYALTWPMSEPTASSTLWFDEFAEALHGFRMQVFFLLAGFFTVMVMQRTGLRALLATRSRRIGVPLAVAMVTIVPLIDLSAAGAVRPEVALLEARRAASRDDAWFGSDVNLHHLWFLWFLCLYLVALALVVPLGRLLWRRAGLPPALAARARPVALVALVPLPVLPQFFMVDSAEDRAFGAASSHLLVPDGRALTYYAMFFAFGALLWNARSGSGRPLVDAVGRHWRLILPVTLLAVLPVALATTFQDPTGARLPAALLQVTYAWGMVIGLIGACGHLLRSERPGVRYLADASYWMYLMHLPLLVALHRGVRHWEVSADVKFAFLCAAVTLLTLASYELFVRHTVLGRVLHGPRPPRARRLWLTRPGVQPLTGTAAG
jgi:glucans biosynthesis protein C